MTPRSGGPFGGRSAVLAFLREHPGATAVDMVPTLTDVGTIVLLPILRELEAEGAIQRRPDLWAEHVGAYPRMHTQPLSSLLVDQAARWDVVPRALTRSGADATVCVTGEVPPEKEGPMGRNPAEDDENARDPDLPDKLRKLKEDLDKLPDGGKDGEEN